MSVKKAIQSFLEKETPFGRKGKQYEAIFIPIHEVKCLALVLQYFLNEGVLKYPPRTHEEWRKNLMPTLLDQLDRKLMAAGFKLRENSTKKLVYLRERG